MEGRRLLAWNLRTRRVELGLTQESLAHEAEVDRSYVGRIERCTENPTVDTLERLAAVLRVPLAALFSDPPEGAGEARPLSPGRRKRTEDQPG